VIPRATYRLQLHAGFPFAAAAQVAPYLARLGISHVYSSPYLQAAPGSTHGYDVIDHNAVNPEIGTEKELMARGLVVKEGGANLLIARPGRTLVPARTLDAAAFTAIDQREVKEIEVPDSTRRYRVISRQSLDAAEVADRKGTEFRGDLKITKPEEFWASSRYLIVVKL